MQIRLWLARNVHKGACAKTHKALRDGMEWALCEALTAAQQDERALRERLRRSLQARS